MLVLARKEKESIVIADCIKITIVEVTGGRVKIGVVAPDEIPVHREEIWNEIQRENEQARLVPRNLVALASQLMREAGPRRKPALRRIL